MKKKPDGSVKLRAAAETLGVSPNTLRNWDRSGKLKATRHPIRSSGLRLLRRAYPKPRRADILLFHSGQALSAFYGECEITEVRGGDIWGQRLRSRGSDTCCVASAVRRL